MKHTKKVATLLTGCVFLLLLDAWAPGAKSNKVSSNNAAAAAATANDQQINNNMQTMFTQGRQIFRYDTFGDEAFWGNTLHLQQAIAGDHLGGV